MVMSSFYLRVEMDWDHMQTDDRGERHPRITVQDDGLHTLPPTLLEKVRCLIDAALTGTPRSPHSA
jgi:hypothetical protein